MWPSALRRPHLGQLWPDRDTTACMYTRWQSRLKATPRWSHSPLVNTLRTATIIPQDLLPSSPDPDSHVNGPHRSTPAPSHYNCTPQLHQCTPTFTWFICQFSLIRYPTFFTFATGGSCRPHLHLGPTFTSWHHIYKRGPYLQVWPTFTNMLSTFMTHIYRFEPYLHRYVTHIYMCHPHL